MVISDKEVHEMCEFMANAEVAKSPMDKAKELYRTRGVEYCVSLLICLMALTTGTIKADKAV